MPVIKFAPKRRMNPKSRWLHRHAANVTSQFGEDGIIAAIFARIGARSRWCVEAGAWDGKYLSNTHTLMAAGWNGVFIEGNASKFPALQETYRGNPSAHLMQALIGLTEADGLDAILSRTGIPLNFDLLSLDIDGVDYYVWEGLNRYRPRIAVVEINPSVSNDVVFIQDRNPTINQGCSLAALIELGKRKGYELIAATRCNAIFVVADEFEKFEIPDNSIDAMFMPVAEARIFQGYDGTLFTAGLANLYWSGRRISHEDIQVLTPAERRYADAPPTAPKK